MDAEKASLMPRVCNCTLVSLVASADRFSTLPPPGKVENTSRLRYQLKLCYLKDMMGELMRAEF